MFPRFSNEGVKETWKSNKNNTIKDENKTFNYVETSQKVTREN
jgi:hypothetical protein